MGTPPIRPLSENYNRRILDDHPSTKTERKILILRAKTRFLTLPKTCTDTMAGNKNGLTTLSNSLTRTNLTDVLNDFANVTCLAPTNVAFTNAGSPDTSLDVPTLSGALKFHTIAGAQYSVGLRDGEVLTSVGGPKIVVRVDTKGNIWFNDAMVIQPNVITNNGVIHVLDKVCGLLCLLIE